MVAGVSTLLLVAEWGGSRFPWGEITIWLMVVGAIALLAAFVWRELRAPEPLVPMALFRNHVFSVTSGIGFIVGFAMFGGIIFLPLFLQIVRGSSPTQAGLEMLPMMAGLLFASVLSGRLIARIGRYKIFPIIGTALATIGMLLLSTMTVTTPYWQIALYMLILGLGIGNVMQVLVLAVQNSVNPKDVGVATSGATFFRSIGGTFGTAIFGAVMTNGIARNLAETLPAGSDGAIDPAQITSAMSTIAALPANLRDLVLRAFTDSLSNVFLTAVPILIIAFVLSLFLKDVRLRGAGDREIPTLVE